MRENDGSQSAVEIGEVDIVLPHLSAALTSSPAGGRNIPFRHRRKRRLHLPLQGRPLCRPPAVGAAFGRLFLLSRSLTRPQVSPTICRSLLLVGPTIGRPPHAAILESSGRAMLVPTSDSFSALGRSTIALPCHPQRGEAEPKDLAPGGSGGEQLSLSLTLLPNQSPTEWV